MSAGDYCAGDRFAAESHDVVIARISLMGRKDLLLRRAALIRGSDRASCCLRIALRRAAARLQ